MHVRLVVLPGLGPGLPAYGVGKHWIGYEATAPTGGYRGNSGAWAWRGQRPCQRPRQQTRLLIPCGDSLPERRILPQPCVHSCVVRTGVL